jgi:D-sedoheptulose 7-phosphate isomerase
VNVQAPKAQVAQFSAYAGRLSSMLADFDWTPATLLADELFDCWRSGRQVFLCGNGGSAANAVHLANDFIYALSKRAGSGLRAEALSANTAVVTSLANDEGYDQIYSLQLAVKARPGDVLIVFTGSGNSPNIVKALEEARRIGMRSYGLLGYAGGKCKPLCDVPLHFAVEDMQLAEDAQLVVGHMVMQYLFSMRDRVAP